MPMSMVYLVELQIQPLGCMSHGYKIKCHSNDLHGIESKGLTIFSRMHATLQPALSVGRFVGWLVGRSVTLYFFYDFFLPHCSCPNGLVTSNMAPAHPHATSVAVYTAL